MAADEICVSVKGVLTRLTAILDEDGNRARQGNGYAYMTAGMFRHNSVLRATRVCTKCLFWNFEPARNCSLYKVDCAERLSSRDLFRDNLDICRGCLADGRHVLSYIFCFY